MIVPSLLSPLNDDIFEPRLGSMLLAGLEDHQGIAYLSDKEGI